MSPLKTLETLLSSPVYLPSQRAFFEELLGSLVAFFIALGSYLTLGFLVTEIRDFLYTTLFFLSGGLAIGVCCGILAVFVIRKVGLKRNQKKWEVEFNDYRERVYIAYKAAKPELFSTRLDLLYQFAQQLKPYLDDQEARAVSAKVQEHKTDLLLRKRNLIKKIDELVQSEREICLRSQSENVFVVWNDHRGSGANTTTITVLLKADVHL